MVKFRVGDIIKYVPLKFSFGRFIDSICDMIIVWATKDRYNHASMVTEVKDGIVYITETHAKTGTVKKIFEDKWLSCVQVVRPKCINAKKISAAKLMESQIGSKYDMTACLLSGFRGLLNLGRRDKIMFDADNEYFCSNEIAVCYKRYGIEISDVDASQCTPSDINRGGGYGEIIYEAK